MLKIFKTGWTFSSFVSSSLQCIQITSWNFRKKATIFNFPYLFALLIVAVKRLQTSNIREYGNLLGNGTKGNFSGQQFQIWEKKSLITSTAKEGEERFRICSIEYKIYWTSLSNQSISKFSIYSTQDNYSR